MLAQQGDYVEAEVIMDDMSRNGYVPGPRAYHALIFSHVKGGNATGALAAIRNEFTAGDYQAANPVSASLGERFPLGLGSSPSDLMQASSPSPRATRPSSKAS